MSRPLPPELLGRLDRALYETAAQSVLFHQAMADRLGMNLTDFECFGLLHQHGPMPAGQLARLAGLTTGAITHVVDRLEKIGKVRRLRDQTDRRRVMLEIVPERLPEHFALFASLADATHDLAGELTDAELTGLLTFLERSQSLMQAEIAKLRGAPANVSLSSS